MAQIETNDIRTGMKLEMEGEVYEVTQNQFVRPGKGQPFAKTKLKHLLNGKVVEKTFKSGEKLQKADILETAMRMLYQDQDGATFMDDETFDQIHVPLEVIKSIQQWLMEDLIYQLVFFKGKIIRVTPPTFLELKVIETDPGMRGDTSGKVVKPAVIQGGAKISVPIFVEEGEIIKVDTRTGEYVSRVK